MGMSIVTGYKGVAHVTSEQGRAQNAGMVGAGKYVFNLGEKFQHEIISNNLIRVKSGYGINQGTVFGMTPSDYEELVIDNGLAGVSRYDLIVARYEKVIATGIESVTLVVIKGTSSATPSDPVYESGNILNGAVIDEYPLYRVVIDGLSITSVVQLFEVIEPYSNFSTIIGDKSTLTTLIKTSIVNAINWIHLKLVSAIAQEYSAISTYTIGEYRFYESGLYKCTTAITVAESWNASHWSAVDIGTEIKSTKDDLLQKTTKESRSVEVTSGNNYTYVPFLTGYTLVNAYLNQYGGLYVNGIGTDGSSSYIIFFNTTAGATTNVPMILVWLKDN